MGSWSAWPPSPLHSRAGDPHEIAEQQRIRDGMARVLLSRRDDKRRGRDTGVEQIAHAMAQAADRVQVDETGATRRLGVAVGHGHDTRLLQTPDVADVRRIEQSVDQRQFCRAGIAEYVLHALAAQISRRTPAPRRAPGSMRRS